MTKAVIDGYTEAIRQNPKDYMSLYDRGAQYYRLSMYDHALTDIAKAITCTPAKESAMLEQEYSLMADIQIELKNYPKALEAVEKALEYNPESYANLYKKGNICLYMKQPEEAYRAFSSMQRLKSRSQEAYFGMAKACVMSGKNEEALGLIKEAEQANPSSYLTYCRTGDLYRDLGENEKAAADYLSAFSLSTGDTRPMESLISLARENYPAVSAAINYALGKTSNPVPLNFLKANIAYLTGNYGEAMTGFDDLTASPEGQEAAVYAKAASNAIALDKADRAGELIAKAISMNPTSDYYCIQARAFRAAGKNEQAFGAATKAKAANPHSTDALVELALARLALEDTDEAIDALNEAVVNDPGATLPLMLRAYIYKNLKNNSKNAVADYSRVANTDSEAMPDVAFKAMAKAFNGKKLDGDAIIERALAANPGKDAAYWGAVYYSQTGSLEKGLEQLRKALDNGYQNIYNLESNQEANLNIAPLRRLR